METAKVVPCDRAGYDAETLWDAAARIRGSLPNRVGLPVQREAEKSTANGAPNLS
jgi:hypothetical protein